MIARSFRPVGWVAAVGTAALGCYMLSLQVAAERAELDRLDARIVTTSQQIRSLQTELGTRGRMQQLEEWNEEVLALSAPVTGQFVGGGVSLARFDVRQPRIAPEADVRLASAATPAPAIQGPAAARAAPPPPLVLRASAAVPAGPPAAPPKPAPPIRIASSEETTSPAPAPAQAPARTAPVQERARPVATAARTAPAPERSRPASATGTRRSAALLDDRTMSALSSAARAERGGGANR